MEKIWLKHYPKGIPENIDPNEYTSILSVFNEAIDKYGDNDSYINMGSSITYAELDELSTQFAAFLQSKGLEKGDRIALQMPNLLQFPVALFGALKAGLTVVNTNPLYTAREMKHQFNDSGAKAIVILANFAHMLEEIIEDTPIETVVVTELGDLFGFPKRLLINAVIKHVKKMVPTFSLPGSIDFLDALDEGKNNIFNPVKMNHEDLAFLQYTGGTTGISKGAMLTHKNIIANMLQVKAWIGGELELGKETIVTALPLYHIFSLTVNCLCFTALGGTNLLITNPKDIPGFIKTLKKSHFTIFTGVNTLYNALMNHESFKDVDFSSLKLSVAGGMALQKAVALRWGEHTHRVIVEGFGLTETSPVACVNPIDGTDRVGTIGLPVPSTEIKVVDDNDGELPIGEEGELCIKGPQVMRGYWQRTEETSQVIIDGWLKTGDVAVVDNDGFAKIVDRKKDMILVSGFNVFPNEIEDVTVQFEGVMECAAIGVPDEKSGEAVKLFIVKKPGAQIEKDNLIEHLKKDLVAYKVPKLIEFRDELPKTNVGKILRRALREG